MEIKINYNFLNNSPYKTGLSEQESSVFHNDKETEIKILRDHIMDSEAICYLLSGYRGVGKTSFINKVEEEVLKNHNDNGHLDKHVFIRMNISSYKGDTDGDRKYTYFLRPVFRQLYLELKKGLYDSIKDENFKKQLDLLYLRSSNDVSTLKSISKSSEILTLSEVDIDLKKLGLPTLLVAGNIPLILMSDYLIQNEMSMLTTLYPLASSSWAAINYYKFNKKITEQNLNKSDIYIKALWDKEIAQDILLNTIKELANNHHINCTFILDEVDKIEEDEDLENLISDLKPIVLDGSANFIFITGQRLFYKYYFSKTKDDDLLDSVFTNAEHIPIFSNTQLDNLLAKLVDTDHLIQIEKDNAQDYKDYIAFKLHLRFESKLIPRKIISILREYTYKKADDWYIKFTETEDYKLKDIKTKKTIIESIELVEKEFEGFHEGIRDYLTMQLYNCAHKIIIDKKRKAFTSKEIVDELLKAK